MMPNERSDEPKRQFYVIVRVRVIKQLQRVAWAPLWWTIADHDGSLHASTGEQFTLSLASIPACDLNDARKIFTSAYQFYSNILDGLPTGAPHDWAGELDAEQHDERMAGYYMDRLRARQEGRPMPPHPYKTAELKIGARVRMAVRLDAVVRDVSDDHGRCFAIEPEILDFNKECRPTIWVDEHEILGAIQLNVATIVRDDA